MTIASINPETGETTRTYDEMQPADVDREIGRAHV